MFSSGTQSHTVPGGVGWQAPFSQHLAVHAAEVGSAPAPCSPRGHQPTPGLGSMSGVTSLRACETSRCRFCYQGSTTGLVRGRRGVKWGARTVALPWQPRALLSLHHSEGGAVQAPAVVCFWSPSRAEHKAVRTTASAGQAARGRVHENFPPPGNTLLIEQIWLLAASS